ncbi:MAG: hypothetical protein V4534_05890 [Myxococcota bacterium]
MPGLCNVRWIPAHAFPPPLPKPAMVDAATEPVDMQPTAAARAVVVHPPAPPQVHDLASRITAGLAIHAPAPTKHGVNGSFFIRDKHGHRCAIFKPMNMEAGMPKNHRLGPGENVQFRESILPGQGAGNEVLAYRLDRHAFEGRYGLPKTILIKLSHPAFEGEELGSAQVFLSNAKPLSDLTQAEREDIPMKEWQKLNFRLISGSTDAHFGNILYSTDDKKLYLIDSGDDFVGEKGQCQYYSPWAMMPKSNQLMTQDEYEFLSGLNVAEAMNVFAKAARANEEQCPTLKVSDDKYLTQILRLKLAKVAGQMKLTQAEWFDIMTRHRDRYNMPVASNMEEVYRHHIRNCIGDGETWQKSTERVNWRHIEQEFKALAQQRINRRRMAIFR